MAVQGVGVKTKSDPRRPPLNASAADGNARVVGGSPSSSGPPAGAVNPASPAAVVTAAPGSPPSAAAAAAAAAAANPGSPPAAASDDGPPGGGDVAPNAVVSAERDAPEEGNADQSPMEMIMSRAKGRVYATDAARFDEEAHAKPDVNEELQVKAESQKAIAGVYQKENGRLAEDLKSALVLLTHLAKTCQQVDQSTLDWKVSFHMA
ncbi:unnamed protein product [Closterium sp. Naga37s-1]|nr:unnamed protein product [Closterium sp. Naga37s-1]